MSEERATYEVPMTQAGAKAIAYEAYREAIRKLTEAHILLKSNPNTPRRVMGELDRMLGQLQLAREKVRDHDGDE